MAQFATVGAMSVLPLIARLLERGESERALRVRIGADPLQLQPTTRLAVRDVFGLWEYAAAALGDDAIPVRIASTTSLESTHLLGLLALTAPTVRSALKAVIAAGALHTDSGAWRMVEEGRSATLRWQRAEALGKGHRLTNEAALSYMVHGLRRLSGGRLEPQRAWLRDAPLGGRALRDLVGCRIETHAADGGVMFSREVLDAVPPLANVATFAILQDVARQELAKLRPVPLVERVQREIAAELASEQEQRSAALVARRLGLSERSLRRKLALAGTSFRTLLEAARRDGAENLLRDPSQSIAEVARKTGYADASAFSHAHRRWHGRPPRARRKLNAS